MKLIEADKVKRVMKDYWKAQVDKALTLTFTDSNEANKRINSYLEHNHELLKAVDELPSAEPESISKWKKEFREYVDSLDIARDDWKGIIEYINDVPTVQPERKTGRWIPVTNGRGGHQCDRCGCYAPSYQSGTEWLSNFCPECNADMRGKQE